MPAIKDVHPSAPDPGWYLVVDASQVVNLGGIFYSLRGKGVMLSCSCLVFFNLLNSAGPCFCLFVISFLFTFLPRVKRGGWNRRGHGTLSARLGKFGARLPTIKDVHPSAPHSRVVLGHGC